MRHKPVVFDCVGNSLVGIIESPTRHRNLGFVIVTGGPQYRIGSHRQFVEVAREIAAKGFPAIRFDYRGMGDSDGDPVAFHRCLPDIRHAIDVLCESERVDKVVLWGLCDGASASMIYGCHDARVVSLILLNPWVRTDAGLAAAYLRHYYVRRLLSRGFWKKIVTRDYDLSASLAGFIANLRIAADRSSVAYGDKQSITSKSNETNGQYDYRTVMLTGLSRFKGPVLFLLSGNDLTADEFESLCRNSRQWRKQLRRPNVHCQTMPDMDHTFSNARWRAEVIERSFEWIDGIARGKLSNGA